jgi:hypothetical protein
MTQIDPFEDFIESDSFPMSPSSKVSCFTVHPVLDTVLEDVQRETPMELMINALQMQICGCAAREMIKTIERTRDEIPDLLEPDKLERLIRGAIAMGFATFNRIDQSQFEDDETANPQQ